MVVVVVVVVVIVVVGLFAALIEQFKIIKRTKIGRRSLKEM